MKELFAFTVNKKIEKEVKEETPEGVLLKKEFVVEPTDIILKLPSRQERELAIEFEAREWSKAVSAGMLTRQMLSKIYSDQGGVFSKDDLKYASDLINEYNEKLLLWQKSSVEHVDIDSGEMQTLKKEITDLYSKIQLIDYEREDLFKNSAENRARDRVIQWLVLNLTYTKENDKKYKLFFGEGSFEEKLNKLYEFSEIDDPFYKSVIEKAVLFITLWHLGKISSKEDFELLEKELNKNESS